MFIWPPGPADLALPGRARKLLDLESGGTEGAFHAALDGVGNQKAIGTEALVEFGEDGGRPELGLGLGGKGIVVDEVVVLGAELEIAEISAGLAEVKMGVQGPPLVFWTGVEGLELLGRSRFGEMEAGPFLGEEGVLLDAVVMEDLLVLLGILSAEQGIEPRSPAYFQELDFGQGGEML